MFIRAFVIAAVLVASPKLVSADCAWVLWQLSTPQGTAGKWIVEAGVPDFKACNALFDDRMIRYATGGESAGLSKTKFDDHTIVVTRLRDKETLQWFQFFCLPDTIDPRK